MEWSRFVPFYFYVVNINNNFSKPCLIKIRVGQFHRIEFLTHVQVDIFQTQRFKSVWIWLLSHSSVTWEVTFEISCLHFVPIKLVSFFGGTYCWVINRVTSKYTFLLWLKDQYLKLDTTIVWVLLLVDHSGLCLLKISMISEWRGND